MSDAAAFRLGLRVGGGLLTLMGLWLMLGGSVVGHYGFGAIFLVMGLIGLFLLPRLIR